MSITNVPLRSGRARGRNEMVRGKRTTEISTRRPSSRRDQLLISRKAKAEAGETPAVPPKRQRGEPAPVGGFEGKEARRWSTYRLNQSNVKRKPAARHKPAAKKALKRA